MSRIIEVTVSPRGEVTVQTKGYDGTSCREASRPYQDALGIATAEHRTAEFYQGQPAKQDLDQVR